jgi:hypothetical protein
MKKQKIYHICTDANKELLGKDDTPTPDMTNLGLRDCRIKTELEDHHHHEVCAEGVESAAYRLGLANREPPRVDRVNAAQCAVVCKDAYMAGWGGCVTGVSSTSEVRSWRGAAGKSSFLTLTSGEVDRPRYWLMVSCALAVYC